MPLHVQYYHNTRPLPFGSDSVRIQPSGELKRKSPADDNNTTPEPIIDYESSPRKKRRINNDDDSEDDAAAAVIELPMPQVFTTAVELPAPLPDTNATIVAPPSSSNNDDGDSEDTPVTVASHTSSINHDDDSEDDAAVLELPVAQPDTNATTFVSIYLSGNKRNTPEADVDESSSTTEEKKEEDEHDQQSSPPKKKRRFNHDIRNLINTASCCIKQRSLSPSLLKETASNKKKNTVNKSFKGGKKSSSFSSLMKSTLAKLLGPFQNQESLSRLEEASSRPFPKKLTGSSSWKQSNRDFFNNHLQKPFYPHHPNTEYLDGFLKMQVYKETVITTTTTTTTTASWGLDDSSRRVPPPLDFNEILSFPLVFEVMPTNN